MKSNQQCCMLKDDDAFGFACQNGHQKKIAKWLWSIM